LASMRDIKRRRDSIRSTEQITKAMKLVATVKLQKARVRLEETRPYTGIMETTVRSLIGRTGEEAAQFAAGMSEPSGKKAVVVITSNRGLAGGYNSHVTKLVAQNPEFPAGNTLVYALGRKGRDALAGKGYEIMGDASAVSEKPEYEPVAEMTAKLMDGIESGKIREVYLAYTQFKNTVVHIPVLQKLFPPQAEAPREEDRSVMEYEPGEDEVLKALIPQYMSSIIYGALIEASASENGARMNAMEAAAGNAEEMIEELELQYNRARQGTITQELTEIIAGAGAAE